MEKRFKFRIYPNKEQEIQIQKNFGCVRFVYNYFLSKRIEKYEAGEGIYGYCDAGRDLTQLKKQEDYAWLREADSHSLQNALKSMDFAFSEFFRRLREKNAAPGFPRFKPKRAARQSYTTQAQKGKNVIYFEGNRKIRLPKLGLIDCRVSRAIEGRILSASVIQTPSGKYFVSVCCTEAQTRPYPKTGAVIGLHFGVKSLAVTSDDERIENNRYLQNAQKKISKLQRRMSRKPKGSANREKARIQLAKAYERVNNQKTDAMQKLTMRLVREYDTICVREEEVSKMIRQHPYSYYLSDASWGEFVRQLKYKCEWYGKSLVKVEPGFPSAQLCSFCGKKNQEVSKKNIQEWICPECKTKHARAKNAAMNTLKEGLRVSA